MNVKKLYTFGDGFCFNHYWPMWSQLLSEILDCEWSNTSTPGMGNEAIAQSVIDLLSAESDVKDTAWIVQWTAPRRLDLAIDYTTTPGLKNLIANDPVYSKNFVTTAQDKTYWCSSASTVDFVNGYKSFVPVSQFENRARMQMLATAYALEKAGVEWRYIFTYDSTWAENDILPQQCCVWPNMHNFKKKSQYYYLDVGEIQPVSSIHLDFLEQYVLPGFSWDPSKLAEVKARTLAADQYRKQNNTHQLSADVLNKLNTVGM